MQTVAGIPFLKMNGLGNEIVVIDFRGSKSAMTSKLASAIAARPACHFDQLMVLHDPRTPGTASYVRIFNADGSEVAACGNGARCVAWVLSQRSGQTAPAIETKAGLLMTTINADGSITVDMGTPKFGWQEIPLAEPFHDTRNIELQVGPIDKPLLHTPSVVNVGNPHCIFWVDDVNVVDLARVGPMLEYHRLFPEQANISLAHVTSPVTITLKVWERGVGLTKACGTAACAAVVAAVRKLLTERRVTVTLPGGDLIVEWRADDHVLMTGPVELEHEGVLDAAALSAASA